VFCESVQCCLQFCLHQLNCVKMAALQLYPRLWKQRNVGWVWGVSQSALNRACYSSTRAWLMLSFLNACLIIPRVCVAYFQRFTQNLLHTCCRIHHKIASSQIHDFKSKEVIMSTSNQLHLRLHCATTAVQMAAPVLEIMDNPLYNREKKYKRKVLPCRWKK
jgi:hypothetical protein